MRRRPRRLTRWLKYKLSPAGRRNERESEAKAREYETWMNVGAAELGRRMRSGTLLASHPFVPDDDEPLLCSTCGLTKQFHRSGKVSP